MSSNRTAAIPGLPAEALAVLHDLEDNYEVEDSNEFTEIPQTSPTPPASSDDPCWLITVCIRSKKDPGRAVRAKLEDSKSFDLLSLTPSSKFTP